jgi:protein disulfide-isomerase A4
MSEEYFKNKYISYKAKYLALKNQQNRGNENIKNIDIMLFKAEWCGHCKTFLPVWNKVKKQYKNKFNFIMYDSEKNKDIMKQWDIKGFPTIMVKKDDIVIDYEGDRSYESFDTMVANLN